MRKLWQSFRAIPEATVVGENGEWEDRANYGLESIEKIVISMHVMK